MLAEKGAVSHAESFAYRGAHIRFQMVIFATDFCSLLKQNLLLHPISRRQKSCRVPSPSQCARRRRLIVLVRWGKGAIALDLPRGGCSSMDTMRMSWTRTAIEVDRAAGAGMSEWMGFEMVVLMGVYQLARLVRTDALTTYTGSLRKNPW